MQRLYSFFTLSSEWTATFFFVQVVVDFHVKLQLNPKDIDIFYRQQSNIYNFFKADTSTESYKELRATLPCKL